MIFLGVDHLNYNISLDEILKRTYNWLQLVHYILELILKLKIFQKDA